MPAWLTFAIALFVSLIVPAHTAPPTTSPTPPSRLPFGLGVNIHFTTPRAGEMDQLAAAGFTFVRMDFDWIRTEKSRGQYDWSAYDTLLAALEPHGIRAVFILDYANPLYDDNRSPDTDAGRAAFARWAAAAVTHFKNRGVLWEMYNEPNISPFWRPKPNTADYIKLALEVGKAVKAAAPDEIFIGPACSTMDFPFLESCFQAGLLEYFSAVSVHPYRQTAPETVAEDYRTLRVLIAKYAPKNKSIPIFSGEWGYSSAWGSYDEAKQGEMLPRQWLTNIANDVPLSIWYDWHDDGPDPKEPEHHFGTVHHDYTPKPAYLAAKTLTSELAGYRLNKRLALAGDDDHLLVFTKGAEVKFAAWSTSRDAHEVTIAGLTLKLDHSVQYVTPRPNDDTLRAIVATPRAPLESVIAAPGTAMGRAVSRGDERVAVDVPISPGDPSLKQRTILIVSNSLRLAIQPPIAGELPVRIENPSGEAFEGSVRLHGEPSVGFKLATRETEKSISLPIKQNSTDRRAAIELLDDAGRIITALHPLRFAAVDFSVDHVNVRAEGDKQVKSTQSLEHSTSGPRNSAASLKLAYDFDAGWKYICVQPKEKVTGKIDGKPRSLSLWLRGDGSGNAARMRFIDSTGQTFQPDGPKITWRDWKSISFPLDGEHGGHWGGANDGVVHYPITLETIFLLDNADRTKQSGEVLISGPTLVYEE